jgi:hypothetical protein
VFVFLRVDSMKFIKAGAILIIVATAWGVSNNLMGIDVNFWQGIGFRAVSMAGGVALWKAIELLTNETLPSPTLIWPRYEYERLSRQILIKKTQIRRRIGSK